MLLRTMIAAGLMGITAFAQAEEPAPMDVQITVNADQPIGPMKPIYRFFGADEPNYAYMKDGRALLHDIGQLGAPPTYFRAHNILCSGDLTPALKWGSTNIYTEDADGKPIYDFTTVDRIFDAYLSNGVRPYVELGFMPEAMSTHPQPYQHSWRPGLPYKNIITGWAYPPKDYDKWRDLCAKLTEHFVTKYGREEVEKWYFECWNEANGDYWKSTPQDWYKLHDYAIDGVRRALPTARVGGPHSAGSGGKFTRDFLEHCLHGTNYATGQKGTPLDFISFHAKGAPTFVDDHVRMGIASQLKAIDGGFKIIREFPELKNTPIVLGESDPDGCAACQGKQLGYRNGTMYASYTAASFARKYLLADSNGVNLEGAVTWAFEFEDQPYFAAQRVMATNGITLPVFNVFRMLAKMTGQRVGTTSSSEMPVDQIMAKGVRATPDIAALATKEGDEVSVLLWHYHDDDLPGPAAKISLKLAGLAGSNYAVTEYRIDDAHSNAYAVWKREGSPVAPDADLYAEMKTASALQTNGAEKLITTTDHTAALDLTLPRQGVALLQLKILKN